MSTISIKILSLVVITNGVFASDCESIADRTEELSKCCTVQDPFPREAFMKCYNAAQGTDEEKIICAAECNFRENGILGPNNELNEEKARDYVDHIEQDEWREQVADIVQSCWAKLDAMKQASAERTTKCPLFYMMMQMCLANRMFVYCPAREWHSSEFCEDAKQSQCLNTFSNGA
ncbi:uncharacterized protein LOC119770342 isoform X1 [Culex quinquefasciatus]|uniref:uncharacterized protein LOC119770342 isoform X1 n=1 Tax=Culex quinquefasciatus TaxID=7176 RepID=UPI0018E32A1F|nr:uncharacterized protein LOC119770342 isoform X1 [Culex quinquefasciatus]